MTNPKYYNSDGLSYAWRNLGFGCNTDITDVMDAIEDSNDAAQLAAALGRLSITHRQWQADRETDRKARIKHVDSMGNVEYIECEKQAPDRMGTEKKTPDEADSIRSAIQELQDRISRLEEYAGIIYTLEARKPNGTATEGAAPCSKTQQEKRTSRWENAQYLCGRLALQITEDYEELIKNENWKVCDVIWDEKLGIPAIRVENDAGFKSIIIGNTANVKESKGYMYLFYANGRDIPFPTIKEITHRLIAVAKQETLEYKDSAYHGNEKYGTLEKQKEYFAEIVKRAAEAAGK